MRYSHDYRQHDQELHAAGVTWTERAEQLTARFEQEAAAHLAGLTREDVGAVLVYLDESGDEAAYFDYENMVGSVYAVTGHRSFEVVDAAG